MLFLVLIPNVFLITPNAWDMYKFFIFAWVPIAVLAGTMLAKTRKIVIVTLVLLSVLTAASVIAYNVGTNYTAASWPEYQLGLWVRSNTPQDSVFLTYYSIQCPPALIGGRIVVSSYVNWPYGWGIPLSEINLRDSQIDAAYTGNLTALEQVVTTYKVSYVYVSNDELYHYPNCVSWFNSVSWLKTVYTNGDLRIYQVESPPSGS
jgi:uncharacterized membrane protein